MPQPNVFLCLLLALASGCASKTDKGAAAESAPMTSWLEGERPAKVVLPPGGAEGAPLLLALHGYSHWGTDEGGVVDYFKLAPAAADAGMVILIPDGTTDKDGDRYWNATGACCDLHNSEVDDVAYLRGLVQLAVKQLKLDASRVYVLGHSNGGFMAHRLACEASETFTAIVSVAGATFVDEGRCQSEHPVGVLQVHGDADETVLFGGSAKGVAGLTEGYPSALRSTTLWAERNRCRSGPAKGLPVDATEVEGPESARRRWYECDDDLLVELWTMRGEKHVPQWREEFGNAALEFLLKQRRRVPSTQREGAEVTSKVTFSVAAEENPT